MLVADENGQFVDRCPGCSSTLPPDVAARAGLYTQTPVMTIKVRLCVSCMRSVFQLCNVTLPDELTEP